MEDGASLNVSTQISIGGAQFPLVFQKMRRSTARGLKYKAEITS